MTLRSRLGLTLLLTAIPLVAGLAWLRQDMERRAVDERLREVAETYMDGPALADFELEPERFGGRLRGRDRERGPRGGRGPRRGERRKRGPGPGAGQGAGQGPGRGPRRGPGSGPRPDGDPGGPPPNERRGPGGPEGEDPGAGPGRPAGRGALPPRAGRAPPARDRRGPPLAPRPRVAPPHETWVWAYGSDYASANPSAPAFPADLQAALQAGAVEAAADFAQAGRPGRQLALFVDLGADEPVAVLVRRVGDDMQSAVPDLIWGGVILCSVLFLVVLLAAGPIVRRVRRLTADVRASAGSRYAEPVDVRGNDEIADLARAFNEAGGEVREHVEDLEQREKTLRRFVANTTHDVMIPLTVLQGHLVAMRKRLAADQPIDAEQIVSSLEESHYMASLVHNLSAVAKLEAGDRHIQRHPVDLNAVVERAVARHRPVGATREIRVDYAVPEEVLRVQGDVTLIEQAVSNLIHNAVRYNEPGGHVAVVLAAVAEPAHGFSLRVLDDGPGIPADQLERLTERRYRSDEARSRHPEGLGLGLDIALDVAQRHDLTLEFRPSEYGGLEAELRGAGLPS